MLATKLPSPEYTAEIVWELTDSEDTLVEVALSPNIATGEPKFTPSILNCTVPDGVPAPGALAVTVAVNDMD